MTRPTLIFIKHHSISGRLFRHGSELPPDILTQDEIDKLLDQRVLTEYPERRSLYRLFPVFSGSTDREQLAKDELDACWLP